MDAFQGFCEKYRKDPDTGENRFCIIQAEDELAAAGMVVGAGWAGARAFTPTSGPGISLMSEFIGFAYYTEIPAVFFDIQRVGPSTGMPTRTQQCDLMLAAYASHGDTRHPVLLPADPKECFEMAVVAFDLAERLQTPVFVLSDLDIGMNDWMVDELQWDDAWRPDRGKVLTDEDLAGMQVYHRFRDFDGDGIPYRTVPGTDHPRAAYFTRGTGHNEYAVYSERSDDWLKNMARLRRKLETARNNLPEPIVDYDEKKPVGIITFGSNDPAVQEARDRLSADGIETNCLRVRALPLRQNVIDFVLNHERVYVVENNFDGQLAQLLTMEIRQDTTHVVSLASGDGLPMSPRFVHENILREERK